jgi:hypothetical protein
MKFWHLAGHHHANLTKQSNPLYGGLLFDDPHEQNYGKTYYL